MIAEGVEHDVAGAEADGKERACAAPGVGVSAFRLEDGAGRGEEPRERAWGLGYEAAEGRIGLVQGREFRLAQHRQFCERGPAGDGCRVDSSQPLGISRRSHRLAQHVRQPCKQFGLALAGIAGLAGVVMVGHDVISLARRLPAMRSIEPGSSRFPVRA